MRKLSMILATSAGLGLLAGAAVPAVAQIQLYIGPGAPSYYAPNYGPYGYSSRPYYAPYYYQPYSVYRHGYSYPYYNQYSAPYSSYRYTSPGYFSR